MPGPIHENRPPDLTDLDAWRQALRSGAFTRYRLEEIVAAIQDLGPLDARDIIEPLAKHLSDALLRILRGRVSIRHHNRGRDIIEATHGKIIEAILQPESADGRALRVAFVPRVLFRIKDAIAFEAKILLYGTANQETVDAIPNDGRWSLPCCLLDERLDVETILENVPPNSKRLAFQLFMQGIPLASNKYTSIARSLNISENTARRWISEVRRELSALPAVGELLKLRGALE